MTWRKIQQDQLIDPRMVSLPAESQMLFVRLQVFSDAHGRLQGNPLTLQHRLVLVGWTPTDTAQHLETLYRVGLVDWYGTDSVDVVIQVVGFDDFQGWQLIRSRGESSLPARDEHHMEGPAIFPELTTTAAPQQHHNSTTTAPQLLREEKRRERVKTVAKTDPVEQLETMFCTWCKFAKHKFAEKDRERLENVLGQYSFDMVAGYLEAALGAKYFWDETRGRSRRKNAIRTLLNVKKDKAGRTYHEKIKGHWPQSEQQDPPQQDDLHIRTLRGVWQ